MIYIDINPVIEIGSFSIRWYGVMVALAVLTVVSWTLHEVAIKKRVSMDTALNAALVGIPSGIIFSRVIHVIDQWDYYFANPGEIIGGEGLAIWGGVLGAALGIWIYSKFAKINYGVLTDMIAPGIILSQAIGRIGCLINGCCYGFETDLACGVIYSHPESYAPLGIPVLPTQLFEIIYNLIVFGILFGLRDRLKPDGSLFMLYLALYSVWRFGIDFIREGDVFLLGLHQSQVIGVVVLLIVLPQLIYKTRWAKKTVPEPQPETEEPQ